MYRALFRGLMLWNNDVDHARAALLHSSLSSAKRFCAMEACLSRRLRCADEKSSRLCKTEWTDHERHDRKDPFRSESGLFHFTRQNAAF